MVRQYGDKMVIVHRFVHMRQQTELWLNIRDKGQCHLQMGVRRVRFVAQRINDQHVAMAVQSPHFCRNIAKIGCVNDGFGLVLKAQSCRCNAAMRLIDIADQNIANLDVSFKGYTLANRRIIFVTFKDVGKAVFEALQSKRPSIARYWFSPLLEYRSEIIDTMTMIGMVMGPDHGID